MSNKRPPSSPLSPPPPTTTTPIFSSQTTLLDGCVWTIPWDGYSGMHKSAYIYREFCQENKAVLSNLNFHFSFVNKSIKESYLLPCIVTDTTYDLGYLYDQAYISLRGKLICENIKQ